MKCIRPFAAALVAGLAIFFLGAMSATSAAAATSAVTVTGVNMRAGPGTGYPAVVTLPANVPLTVYGCTADTSWCDSSWGGQRGWVAASYVQVIYRGNPVVVTPAIIPAIGLGVVAFNQAYWHTHYAGRPWYGQWNRYYGGASRSVAAGCNGHGCGAASVTRGPYGGGRAAVGGCNDRRCGGAVATRGPRGNVVVRHGSIPRR